MVVEGDRRLFGRRDFIPGLQQGPQTAFGCGDAGKESDDAADSHDPDAQTEPGLKPESQIQEQAQWEQNGQTKLTDPQKHGKNLHKNLRRLCRVVAIITDTEFNNHIITKKLKRCKMFL